MNENNINSWVSQQDVCRCCLSAIGTWDMNSKDGNKEVISVILQKCCGITLSFLSELGLSHVVCGSCLNNLQDANRFRKQVLMADKYYLEFYNRIKGQRVLPEIKLEIEELSNDDFVESGSRPVEGSFDCQIMESKRNNKKEVKLKCKGETDVDYDSDVPIAELQEEILLDRGKKSTEITNAAVGDDCTIKEPQYTTEVSVRQISERKRVILTCATILRDTTACPFRHHKSWFQCFFCTEEFLDIATLRCHVSADHEDVEVELRKIKRYPRSLQIEISNLQCRNCQLDLADLEAMRCHFELVHNKIIYKECIADYKVNCSPYSCHLCDQEFHVFRTLTTHLNEHYANCLCDVCGRSFLNSKRLKVHKRTHESGLFPCLECGKILKTKTSKANHMESAHSKRQLKCQICFKPMKHYNDRIKHMSAVHNITNVFKCKICFKEYNVKHYLATHMRQTHGNKNKKCPECGMAFVTNHGLKKHMLKHSGVKAHKCLVCGKAYARKYSLREHMRVHDSNSFC